MPLVYIKKIVGSSPTLLNISRIIIFIKMWCNRYHFDFGNQQLHVQVVPFWKNKMSRKIHPVSLRLGKRICWSSVWSVDNKNYGSSFFKFIQRKHNDQYFTNFLTLNSNEIFVSKTNKQTKIFSKVFSNENNEKIFETSQASKMLGLTKHNECIGSVSPTNGSNDYNFFLINPTNYKQKLLEEINKSVVLPVFDAQCFSEYIAKQVSAQANQKTERFSRNLLTGIANFTILVLKRIKLNRSNIISGLKIECAGRWKQTGSGRKQKLIFIAGSVKTQSFQQYLSYGFSTINTKFGSCTFKVWIGFKSLSI